MGSQKKDKALHRINIFLSFLQSVFLALGLVVVLVYFAFLSPHTIKQNLDRSQYFSGLTTQIVHGAQDILIPTGFPASILADTIDRYNVHSNIREHVDGEFSGQRHVLDTEEMINTLRSNMEDYLGYHPDAEVSDEMLDQIVETLVTHYENQIQFPFISQIARLVTFYRQAMMIVGAACAIFFLITSFMIKKINRWQHRVFRYWAYGIGAAGLMLMVAPLIIKYQAAYTRLAIYPRFAYNFVVMHIDRGLMMLILGGGAALSAAIVLATFSTYELAKIRKFQKEKRF